MATGVDAPPGWVPVDEAVDAPLGWEPVETAPPAAQAPQGSYVGRALEAYPGLVKDYFTGQAKGVGSTVAGLGELLTNIPGVSEAGNTLLGSAPGAPGIVEQSFADARDQFAPQGVAQHIGKGAEQIGEFLLAGEAKAPSLIEKVMQASKLARALGSGLQGGGVVAAQTGGNPDATALGALGGAAVPFIPGVAQAVTSPLKAGGLAMVDAAIKRRGVLGSVASGGKAAVLDALKMFQAAKSTGLPMAERAVASEVVPEAAAAAVPPSVAPPPAPPSAPPISATLEDAAQTLPPSRPVMPAADVATYLRQQEQARLATAGSPELQSLLNEIPGPTLPPPPVPGMPVKGQTKLPTIPPGPYVDVGPVTPPEGVAEALAKPWPKEMWKFLKSQGLSDSEIIGVMRTLRSTVEAQ